MSYPPFATPDIITPVANLAQIGDNARQAWHNIALLRRFNRSGQRKICEYSGRRYHESSTVPLGNCGQIVQ